MSAGLDVEAVLVDLFRAASPIRHEPLATKVAEEWAAKAGVKVREAVAAWLESETESHSELPEHWSAIERVAYSNGLRTAPSLLAEKVRT